MIISKESEKPFIKFSDVFLIETLEKRERRTCHTRSRRGGQTGRAEERAPSVWESVSCERSPHSSKVAPGWSPGVAILQLFHACRRTERVGGCVDGVKSQGGHRRERRKGQKQPWGRARTTGGSPEPRPADTAFRGPLCHAAPWWPVVAKTAAPWEETADSRTRAAKDKLLERPAVLGSKNAQKAQGPVLSDPHSPHPGQPERHTT